MEEFGKYQLVRRVGTGGMAEVFLARTTVAQGLSKSLVIKKIHPAYARSKQFTTMFVDEARIALGLNHPNIVQVFDFGTVGGTFFLAMEYVEGLDLLRLMQQAIKQKKPVPLVLSAYIVQQVAKGLDYAHRKSDEFGDPLGIVHRDISPQNVLVSWDGGVKIVDFGIARARHVQEEEGVVKGKFAYMSPEQARGESVDRRSDVFSAGVVLFELLCGRPLYPGKGKQILEKVKAGAIPRPKDVNPQIPDQLEETIVKSLTFHRDDRFQTARDLQHALGRYQLQHLRDGGDLIDSSTLAQFVSQLIPAHRRTPTARPPTAPGRLDEVEDNGSPSQVAEGTHPGVRGDTPLPITPKPTIPKEVRQRKYLFVVEGHISGLPAMEAQFGQSEATKVVDEFFKVATDIAFKHDAQVHRREGTELTMVVGLPVAGEDDASRAIRLGLTLIETLEAIVQDLEPKLRLGIGIQRGAALVKRLGSQFSYEIGEVTTAIARRLASMSEPGQIMLGGAVYRVAGSDWNFKEVDSIELPGNPDTQPSPDDTGLGNKRARVFLLEGPKEREQLLRERHRSVGEFIGRELELKSLRDAYRDVVVNGRKRHVLIVGEAGIGKRALVNELVGRISPDDVTIIRAAARAAASFTPFAIVADLAREYLGLADGASPEQVRERLSAAAHILYPGDAHTREARGLRQIMGLMLGAPDVDNPEGFDADERRQRLVDAMIRVEKKLAADRPLVIVVEDVHWADQESMDVFAEVLRAPANRGILGLITVRPESTFIRTVKDAQADILQLEELGERQRLELITVQFAPDEEVADLAKQILARAGGNPFFIQEILDALTDRGILVAEPPDARYAGLLRWVKRDAPLSVPTSVEAVLATRIDKLPPGEKETLMHAAVLGKSISAGAVEGSLGRPVQTDLDQLMVRGLVSKQMSGYAFRNDMTMQVAYGLIPYEGRRELHHNAARNLATSPAYRTGQDDAIVARHLELAGDSAEAAGRYLRAAEHAVDVGGNAEAFRLLTRALKLFSPDDHERRFDARRQREEILRRLVRRPAQLREIHYMRKEAEALDDPAKLAKAHARLVQFYIDVGKAGSALKAIPAARDFAQKAGNRLAEAEALSLQASIARLVGEHDNAIKLSEEALVLCGDDREGLLQRAFILNNLGTTLWNMGLLPKASDAYAEGLVIYRMLKLPREEARLLNNMGIVFSALGEYEEALAHFKSSLKIDQKLGDRAGIALKLGNIGQTYSDLGELERGQRYLDKALALTRQHDDRATRTDVLISLGQCYLYQNKPALAVERITEGLTIATEGRERYQEVRARIYLALAQLEANLPASKALELARSATELAHEMPMPVGEVYGLAVQGLALAKLDRAAEGAALAHQAVGLQENSKQPEGFEQILHIAARLSEQAGLLVQARTTLRRALDEVNAKAKKLHDKQLRASYVASKVPRAIRDDFNRLVAD